MTAEQAEEQLTEQLRLAGRRRWEYELCVGLRKRWPHRGPVAMHNLIFGAHDAELLGAGSPILSAVGADGVGVSATRTADSAGNSPTSRFQSQRATCSLVGFSRPSTSFR